MSADDAARRGRHDAAFDRGCGDRGVALIVVLWAMALLSVLIIGFAGETRTGLRMARNQLESARAKALAETGFSLAVLGLVRPGPGGAWAADGSEHRFAVGNGEVRVRVEDEAGKVDLNGAPEEILEGLFRSLGFNPATSSALAAAIQEWKGQPSPAIDSGIPLIRSAEEQGTFGTLRRSFSDLDDLRRVPGVTAEAFSRIRPFVTVWSRSARINPATAPLEVLRAVPGVSPGAVDDLLGARAAGILAGAATLPAGGERYFSRIPTSTVTIRSEGLTPSGASFIREAVVVLTRTPAAPYQILSWRKAPAAVPEDALALKEP